MYNRLYKIFLIINFCLLSGLVFSQNYKLDSLNQKLKSTSRDTFKVNLLNQIGLEYRNTEPDKAVEKFKEAYKLAENLDFKRGIAESLYNLGLINKNKGNYKEALSYYYKSLSEYSRISDLGGQARNFNGIGQIYMYQSQFDKSFSSFQQSLSISRQAEDNKNTASVLNNIGLLYMTKADYEKALVYYLKSLKMREFIHDSVNMSSCHNNIGAIYYYLGNYDKAIEHYEISLGIQQRFGSIKETAEILNNLGALFYTQKNYYTSADYYEKSLDLRRQIDDKKGIAAVLSNIGLINESLGNYDEALKNMKEALQLYQDLGDIKGEATASYYIGSTLSQKGDHKSAVIYIENSISIANSLKIYDILKEAYRTLAENYEKTGNLTKAYYNYKHYMALRDSVLSIETSNRILELQAKYETEKNQKEIRILEQDKQIQALDLQRQKNLLTIQLVVFLSIVILLLFISFIVYIYFRNREIKRRNRLQQELNKYMQKALSQQMNPHFIFNTVNSIQHYILNNDKMASNKYLTMFARLMRITLENSQHHMIPLRDELAALNLYLELESLRFDDKFDYNIVLDVNHDISACKIPTLLIQPFVENSIWHGLMHKEGKGKIDIHIFLKGKNILCVIEDDGIGREKAIEIKKMKNSSHKSLGTTITENRLKLINSLYEQDMSVNYTDLYDNERIACGTKVEIYFPVLN